MQSNRPGTAATFVEEDGRTVVTVFVQHGGKGYRDAHDGYGMEGGTHEALDYLEQIALFSALTSTSTAIWPLEKQ